jgi:hypothetical protein
MHTVVYGHMSASFLHLCVLYLFVCFVGFTEARRRMQEIEASRESRRVGKMDTLQARMANLSRQIDDLRHTTASLESDFATSSEVGGGGAAGGGL